MYPDTLPRCLHTLDLLVLDQSASPGTSSHEGSGAGLPAVEFPRPRPLRRRVVPVARSRPSAIAPAPGLIGKAPQDADPALATSRRQALV
jgi:hypothetical protein